jgi:hypothetical protein
VGDVDALRRLERLGSRDIRMVDPQQAAPGHVDRLEGGVDGHTESAIEVVGRDRWAWRHDRRILVVGRTRPRYARDDDGRGDR